MKLREFLLMFRIKICGITNAEDAEVARDAGADAIGLNFFERSPRAIQCEKTARRISDSIGSLGAYGVFVNASESVVRRWIEAAHLCGIQLHGDEPPELVASWSQTSPHPLGGASARIEVVRAHRLGVRGLEAIREELDACRAAGGVPNAVLIDAAIPGQYGGTGQPVAWNRLENYRLFLPQTALILAGGLTPENVAEAIRIVRPFGVDVASGVEASPGKKDPTKVRDFIAAAAEAMQLSSFRSAR